MSFPILCSNPHQGLDTIGIQSIVSLTILQSLLKLVSFNIFVERGGGNGKSLDKLLYII